jgi:hypothetical protein
VGDGEYYCQPECRWNGGYRSPENAFDENQSKPRFAASQGKLRVKNFEFSLRIEKALMMKGSSR